MNISLSENLYRHTWCRHTWCEESKRMSGVISVGHEDNFKTIFLLKPIAESKNPGEMFRNRNITFLEEIQLK